VDGYIHLTLSRDIDHRLMVEPTRSNAALNPDEPPPVAVEVKYGFRAFVVLKVTRIMTVALICLSSVAIVWVLSRAVVDTAAALAGKTTHAHIDQSLSLGVQASGQGKVSADVAVETPGLGRLGMRLAQDRTVWILLAVCAAVGLAYAARVRKRMKDCIQQFSPFRKRFELQHDPRRSSADLTDRGDSPSED
jgi:hypothetical protein